MSKIELTTFYARKTANKIPVSTLGNNEFIFNTEEFNFNELPEVFKNNYILNTNLKMNKIRGKRKQTVIKPYKTSELAFIILDIDKVNSKENRDKIVNFFKEQDYKVILLESRSYDGIKNFNMKGLMVVKGYNNKPSIKKCLLDLNKNIKEWGLIDNSILSESSYQAPTLNNNVIFQNDGKNIPEYYIKEKEIKIDFQKTSNLLDVCLNEYKKLGFKVVKENSEVINFEHPKEKSKKGYFVFKNNPSLMNHFDGNKSFNIFNRIKSSKEGRYFLEELSTLKRKEKLKDTIPANSLVINQRYIKVDKKLDNYIDRFFKEDKNLKIKSAMGTGKSNIISKIIEKCEDKGLKYLIITNRISVAKDFSKKYNCKLYLEDNYEKGDSIIVQNESLWRYDVKDFDIVILDEFLSLMMHSRNALTRYSNINKSKLNFLLKKKKLVIADAFLFGLEEEISNKPFLTIYNKYRDDITLTKYSEKGLISKILDVAEAEKENGFKNKITISSTNKKQAKVFEYILKNKGYNVIVLDADTSEMTKEKIYEAFKLKEHNFWDILIYTPTLTVGVSNENNVEHHFHFDSSNSADVISSLQMIKRTRKAKNIHYCVYEKKKFEEININNLNETVLKNIKKYGDKNEKSFLYELDDEGELKLSKLAHFVNLIEVYYNILESNHLDSFELLLNFQFKKKVQINVSNRNFEIIEQRRMYELEERRRLNKTLLELKKMEWDYTLLNDYKYKSHIANDEEQMLKMIGFMSEHFQVTTKDKLLEIAKKEINSNFKYIQSLMRLKIYTTNDEYGIRLKLKALVGNTIDRKKIKEFEYFLELKKLDIKLKEEFTSDEIKRIDDLLTLSGNRKKMLFKTFLRKVGYENSKGNYYLDKEVLEDMEILTKTEKEN